jgi:uncharacterized membrane-anchored protein
MLQKKYFLISALVAFTALPVFAQTSKRKTDINIVQGPASAKLGDVAHIGLPAGYEFMDGKTTRAFMKATGQPSSGDELGMMSPTNGNWSIMFEFNATGYIKDDDKDKLNPDKILADIKRGNEEANKERKRMGSSPIEVIGWDQPPHYDEATHNLEWAIRGRSEGHDILNYNTRLLGRKGVMEVVLICDPEDLQKTLPTFKGLLSDYKYDTGQSYAEYKPGDKVAKYGLAALVVGGAAVGAAKLGLFAWLAVFLKKGFKLIIVALVAIAAAFKKLIGKITGRAARE